MTEPRQSYYAIAAGIGVLALVALAVLPIVTNSRLNELRRGVEDVAQPARRHLSDINYLLSLQMSNLSRAAATRNPEYVANYREASAARSRAMVPLAALAEQLGPNVRAKHTELQTHIGRWESSVERYLEASAADAGVVLAAMAQREASYANVIRDLRNLDSAITEFELTHTNELRRVTIRETRLSFALTILAMLAAMIVVWLQWRLHKTAGRLAREVRARDEILGIVSHDLRSPLTTISLSSQMLSAGTDGDDHRQYVEMIRTTASRMERLIQDLLDAVKVENSTLSIHPERIDPATIAEEALQEQALVAGEKKVNLVPDIAAGLPEIEADRQRLVQALTNLISNALKFTPAGGTVRLRVSNRDHRVRFAVEDSGPGIEQADLPHLFEPFWQAKKTAHLGAGLGLKITRGIVEAHGGTIEVSNRAGGGACFTFELPT